MTDSTSGSTTDRPVRVPDARHPITITPQPARVVVTVAGRVVADTRSALTLREASYPPVHYVPLADVDPAVLARSGHATYCPYKGEAGYYDLVVDGQRRAHAVWTYEQPYDAVAAIAGHVAFYPHLVDGIDVVA